MRDRRQRPGAVRPADAAAADLARRRRRRLRAGGTDVVVVPAPDMSVGAVRATRVPPGRAGRLRACSSSGRPRPPQAAGATVADIGAEVGRAFAADPAHVLRRPVPPVSSAGYARIAAALARTVVAGGRAHARDARPPDPCVRAAGRPAARRGAALRGRPAGRAGSGRRSRRRARRRPGPGPAPPAGAAARRSATETSWCPRSTPQLPASPQQPPSRVTRAPAVGQQRARPPTSRAPTRGGSAAGRRSPGPPATAAASPASR